MRAKPRALVTGASRGIGAAIAFELGRAGFPVIVNYRSQKDAAEQTAESIRATEAKQQPARLTSQTSPRRDPRSKRSSRAMSGRSAYS